MGLWTEWANKLSRIDPMNPEVPKSIPHVFGDGRMPTERNVPFFVWNERSTRLWEWLHIYWTHDHRLSLRRQPGQKGRGLNTTPKQNQKAKPPPTARSNLSAKNPPAPDMFSANSLSADEDDSYNDERQRMDLSRTSNLQEER